MLIRFRNACGAAVAFVILGCVVALHAQTNTPQPYASIATDGESYAGPGRSTTSDLTGKVVRIGLLAPMTGARKPEGDAMVAAAQMALQDAAPSGLVGGRRITLAVEDSSGPSWGIVSDAVIRLVLQDEVIVLITSISGADAHLSEQVGNRVGVAVLTLSSDPTSTQIDIPWIFRIGASDTAEAEVIARDVYAARHLQHMLLVTQHDHDGDRGSAAMRRAAATLGAVAPDIMVVDQENPDVGAVAKRIEATSPQALVIWTNVAVATHLLRTLRAIGVIAPCYVPEEAASNSSKVNASEATIGETLAISEESTSSVAREVFAKRYLETAGLVPNSIANRTYDAVTLAVQAVRAAGPNRARVRDRLSQAQKFDGMSGTISFDREGNDEGLLRLVRLP